MDGIAPPAEETVRAFRDRYFKCFLRLNPEANAGLGLSEFRELDGRWTDFSSNGQEDRAKFLEGALRETEALLASPIPWPADDRLDLDLIALQARFELHSLRHSRDILKDFGLFLVGGAGPFAILHHQVLDLSCESGPESWEALLGRLERLPTLAAQAAENLRAGRARGMALDREHAERDGTGGAHALASYLRSDLLSEFRRRARPDVRRIEAPLVAAAEKAARAMEEYSDFIRSEILPGTVEGGLAIGEEEYGLRLNRLFGPGHSPEEVLRLGQEWIAEWRQRLLALAQRHGWGNTPQDALRSSPRRVPASDRELFDAYAEANARALRFIEERDLYRAPREYGMEWITTPSSMDGYVTVAAYFTPRLFRPGAVGRFCVGVAGNPARLANCNLHAIPFIVAHEACPGHTLQFSWFIRDRESIPKVRLLDPGNSFLASPTIEGFAHDGEGVMLDHGFYRPEEEAFALFGMLWRAARVVVDASLHLKLMNPAEATRFLVEQGLLDERLAAEEVYRFRRFPTQAAAYALGRRQIRALRDELRRSQDGRFDEAWFHESFARCGFAPPRLARSRLLARSTSAPAER